MYRTRVQQSQRMVATRPFESEGGGTSFYPCLFKLLSHARCSRNSCQATQSAPHKKHQVLRNPIRRKKKHQRDAKIELIIDEELRKRQKAAQNSSFQTETSCQTEKTSRETPETTTTKINSNF
jgi:hypothetical protein